MAGYMDHQTGSFIYVDEMEPEIVVPDLTDFKASRNQSVDSADMDAFVGF